MGPTSFYRHVNGAIDMRTMNSGSHSRISPTVDHFFTELWHSAAEALPEFDVEDEDDVQELPANSEPRHILPDWNPELGPEEIAMATGTPYILKITTSKRSPPYF